MGLTQLAILQKMMGYGLVIMAANNWTDTTEVIIGCAFGIALSEMADVWYKLILKAEKKSA